MPKVYYQADFAELREKINQNNFNVHDQYKHLSVEELKEICRSEQNPFSVCLLNVTGDLNVGVSIRSASLMGAERVFVFGRRKFDNRSLVGADKYIEVVKLDGMNENLEIVPEEFEKFLHSSGYLPVFVELGGLELGKFCWRDQLTVKDSFLKPMFIFGNEGMGIPEKILEIGNKFEHSFRVSIPQKGVLRSFNVSAAANIIGWDFINSLG